MESCDVLIVGGGPAGSTCAWKLRRAGLDVLVLDKKAFPRDKVCAGWITPAVVEELELNVEEYRSERVFQPILGFRTGLIHGGEVTTNYGTAVSYGIRRCEFDEYLLRRSGARLLLGEALESLERSGSDWLVNGRIHTPLVVGAGGHFCPVARRLATGPGRKESIVAAQEVEFLLNEDQLSDCPIGVDSPELYFCRDLKGYAWAFRKGNYLNIGLGREDNSLLSRHVAEFIDFLKTRGRLPGEIPDRFHGHAYLLYGQTARPVSAAGMLLIGDAAGLAYPRSGEGIRPAVESALLAAEVILEAGADYRAGSLAAYDRALEARFGLRRGSSAAVTGWIPRQLTQTVGGWLMGSRAFCRHVVLDRWFLRRWQRPLAVGSRSPG